MKNQELLALFFAIFWGGILNVQARWLMFQPVLRYDRIRSRFLLSFLVMVLLPILYFAWQAQCVGEGIAKTIPEVFAAVLPALGVFAFYRLWMVVIELRPSWFYWRKSECVPHHRLRSIDPSIEDLNIGEGFTTCWNFLAAVFYGVLAVGFAWLIRVG